MSQENVEIVRRMLEEFNRGGADAVINGEFLSTEIVFDASRSGIPGVGVLRGQEDVRAFFEADWFGAFPFEDWEIRIEEPIDRGDQVVFISRQHGRGASSGAATALELGNIFTLRKGKITRMEIYGRPEEALEAAGLAK
jgi:ketosteroid isomerase-like protein